MITTASDLLDPLASDIAFDEMKTQMQNAPGFPHFCLDGFLDAAFADEVLAAFPSYQQARALGQTFEAVNEKHKIQVTDSSTFEAPLLRLHQLLASDAFVRKMSEISGIADLVADPALSGGGIHETRQGGRLDVHVDFNFNEALGLYRRLNMLVYFNKDWREEYGGYLDLWDRNVRHCIGRYAPIFNRAAGFATSDVSWHGVTPVHCPPDQCRKSFAVYYYSKEPPSGWDGMKRSTVFRARPDEYWRGTLAMPAENLLRRSGEAARAVRQSVRKIFPR